jgi:HNH endonuclease
MDKLLEERFWSKVKIGEPIECWPWLWFVDRDGYGRFGVGRSVERAHRIAYELTYGPTELHVLHKCDNPTCCNPGHLFAGTGADNVADRLAKGRQDEGDARGRALLTSGDVQELRRMRAEGTAVDLLAIRFRVSKSAIYKVLGGRAWKHVP